MTRGLPFQWDGFLSRQRKATTKLRLQLTQNRGTQDNTICDETFTGIRRRGGLQTHKDRFLKLLFFSK